jgi:glycosyltransferase involved in cell wall biosynthesis
VLLVLWDRSGLNRVAKEETYRTRFIRFRAPQDQPSVALFLPLWWLCEFIILLTCRAEIIHACDLDTLIPAVLVKEIKRTKLCYSVFDFYADNLPWWVPARIRSAVANLERACARRADCLFLANEDQIGQLGTNAHGGLSIIYNTPPDAISKGVGPPPSTGDLSGSLRLFYAGILHESRGLKCMLEAISELPSCELEIAGNGPDETRLLEMARKLKDRIRFLGWLAKEDVIGHSLQADVLFGFYDPGVPNSRVASPNKLFEAMMLGKPFLTNTGTFAARVVTREDCGMTVPYGDVEATKRALSVLLNDPKLRKELGARGRRAYEERYSWTKMERRIVESYRQVMSGSLQGADHRATSAPPSKRR